MAILNRDAITELVAILHAMPEGQDRDNLDNWMIANNIYVELASAEFMLMDTVYINRFRSEFARVERDAISKWGHCPITFKEWMDEKTEFVR